MYFYQVSLTSHSVSFQSSLIDLKEHASSLASASLKKDSRLKSLEIAIEQKKEECSKLETQLQKVCRVAAQGPSSGPAHTSVGPLGPSAILV